MRCLKCDREIDEKIGKCTYCEEDESVRVISKEEIVGYQGVTIDTENDTHREEEHYYDQNRPKQHIYVKNINIGKSNWLTKIAIFVILAAIASFLLFVALPVALIGIGIGLVVWMVLSFVRG